MAVYDTPYYGQRRRALTGQSYGPYYGMSLSGGGALPTEGRRALPAEISEKYEATGTPAITEGPESATPSPAMESSFADDPGASWAIPSYALLGSTVTQAVFGKKGLDAAKAAFPEPTFKGYGVVKGAVTYAGSKLGAPLGAVNIAFRTVINPILAYVLPTLGIGTAPTTSNAVMDVLSSAQIASTSIVGPEGATFGVGALGNVGLVGIGEGELGSLGFATGEGFGQGEGEGEGESGGGFGFGGFD